MVVGIDMKLKYYTCHLMYHVGRSLHKETEVQKEGATCHTYTYTGSYQRSVPHVQLTHVV